MHNPASVLENETHKLLLDFEIQTYHLISARWQDLIIINKKWRTCRIVDFTVSTDHRVKLKESEKKDKYLDLARKFKKNCGIWKWRLVQSPKDWYKDNKTWKYENAWKPSKQLYCWDQPETWEESWRLEETCGHSNFSERLSANDEMKNSQGVIMIIIIKYLVVFRHSIDTIVTFQNLSLCSSVCCNRVLNLNKNNS